jgi:chromate transporter
MQTGPSEREPVVAEPAAAGAADGPPTSLGELAGLFLRLGATAFGGPAAHIAMMQQEVVHRRRWLTEERFLDLLGATNLIPGPNSTEMAIHIGWQRRRWAGLCVAGLSFIVPAMLMTGALAWAYVRWQTVPAVGWLLYGVAPVILAVIVQAIWRLAPKAARTWRLRVLGGIAAAAVVIGGNEIGVLLGAGAVAVVLMRTMGPRTDGEARASEEPRSGGVLRSVVVPVLPVAAGVGASAITLPTIFWVFLKIGSVLFGSGYVLLAFLRADLVERLGWLTEAQLVDAIAVGQVTPGPVFTTATFIGYVLAGPQGALVATLGIFLPAFVFVALSGPLVPRLRASAVMGAFLDGVVVASLALMVVVTVQLGRAALVDVPTVVLAGVAAVLLVRFDVGATRLVIGGAAEGWAIHAVGLAG